MSLARFRGFSLLCVILSVVLKSFIYICLLAAVENLADFWVSMNIVCLSLPTRIAIYVRHVYTTATKWHSYSCAIVILWCRYFLHRSDKRFFLCSYSISERWWLGWWTNSSVDLATSTLGLSRPNYGTQGAKLFTALNDEAKSVQFLSVTQTLVSRGTFTLQKTHLAAASFKALVSRL